MPKVIERTKSRQGAERWCEQCARVIEPGQPYLQWSFRYGGTHYRCTDHPPRPSDLTQSKLAEVYAAIESAEDGLPAAEDAEAVGDLVAEVKDAVYQVAEEYREAAEPFGGEGENAERADELEGWAQELESFYPDTDAPLEDVRSEASEMIGGCPL
jgi:hypothetical protein